MFDGFLIKNTVEGSAGHTEDLFGTKAISQQIIQEEVVQIIGAYQIFCFLGDLIRFGRQQFGRNRGVQNVP